LTLIILRKEVQELLLCPLDPSYNVMKRKINHNPGFKLSG